MEESSCMADYIGKSGPDGEFLMFDLAPRAGRYVVALPGKRLLPLGPLENLRFAEEAQNVCGEDLRFILKEYSFILDSTLFEYEPTGAEPVLALLPGDNGLPLCIYSAERRNSMLHPLLMMRPDTSVSHLDICCSNFAGPDKTSVEFELMQESGLCCGRFRIKAGLLPDGSRIDRIIVAHEGDWARPMSFGPYRFYEDYQQHLGSGLEFIRKEYSFIMGRTLIEFRITRPDPVLVAYATGEEFAFEIYGASPSTPAIFPLLATEL